MKVSTQAGWTRRKVKSHLRCRKIERQLRRHTPVTSHSFQEGVGGRKYAQNEREIPPAILSFKSLPGFFPRPHIPASDTGCKAPRSQLPPSLRPSPLPVPPPVTLPSSKANPLQSIRPSRWWDAFSGSPLGPGFGSCRSAQSVLTEVTRSRGPFSDPLLLGHAPSGDTCSPGVWASHCPTGLSIHLPGGFCFLSHTLTMEATARA